MARAIKAAAATKSTDLFASMAWILDLGSWGMRMEEKATNLLLLSGFVLWRRFESTSSAALRRIGFGMTIQTIQSEVKKLALFMAHSWRH